MDDVCHCGLPAARRTSWSANNPGRGYMACQNSRWGGCNFFAWTEPRGCKRCLRIIPGLIRRLDDQRVEMENDREATDNEMELKNLELEKKQTQLNKIKKREMVYWLVLLAILVFYCRI
ncbi:hypothetical protein OROMI_014106 [Orobanche minor]